MGEIIPFDFEEQAVRVVMRDGEPWFVAADVCRVLDLGNPSQAISRLDDDEVTLITNEGSHRPTNVVSESGLYALVLTSRKEAAKRFRKWITAEVLPAIRRTGRYDPPSLPVPDATDMVAGLGGCAPRDAELWLSMVREARLLGGTRAGRSMWDRSPLPPLMPRSSGPQTGPAEARACLAYLLAADLDGRPVAEWLMADGPIMPAPDVLSRAGLRILADAGLFVANATGLFAGSAWAGGMHRTALLSLPGVTHDPVSRTLAGQASRGIVLPFALLEEVCHA